MSNFFIGVLICLQADTSIMLINRIEKNYWKNNFKPSAKLTFDSKLLELRICRLHILVFSLNVVK